jgi:hypothetical protein
MLFCRHYFSPLNTLMSKEKDPDPQLFLMDPDPGGPKHADPDPQHCKKSAFFPVFTVEADSLYSRTRLLT